MKKSRVFVIAGLGGLLSTAGCGPVADRDFGDPNAGSVKVIRDGRVLWDSGSLPLRRTLTINKNDGFHAVPPNDQIRVQVGSFIQPPPTRWDILANVHRMEDASDIVFQDTIAVIDNASDADSAWKSLLAIDDAFDSSSTYYPYASYSPALHNFDAKSSGLGVSPFAPLTGLRVYDRGSCSLSRPWSDIYDALAGNIATSLACGIKCAGRKPIGGWVGNIIGDILAGGSQPGLVALPQSLVINYAESSRFGFFPLLRRGDEGGAFGFAADAFALYGRAYISIKLANDQRAVYEGAYKFDVDASGDVQVGLASPNGYRVMGSTDLVNALGGGIKSDIPQAISDAINNNSGRKQRLPTISFNKDACEALGKPIPCSVKRDPCNPGDTNSKKSCAQNVSAAIDLGAGKFLMSGVPADQIGKERAKYTADIREEDFSCEADKDSTTGFSCAYKVPFERVNVYPDSFELVFRAPTTPGARGVHRGLCRPRRCAKRCGFSGLGRRREGGACSRALDESYSVLQRPILVD